MTPTSRTAFLGAQTIRRQTAFVANAELVKCAALRVLHCLCQSQHQNYRRCHLLRCHRPGQHLSYRRRHRHLSRPSHGMSVVSSIATRAMERKTLKPLEEAQYLSLLWLSASWYADLSLAALPSLSHTIMRGAHRSTATGVESHSTWTCATMSRMPTCISSQRL